MIFSIHKQKEIPQKENRAGVLIALFLVVFFLQLVAVAYSAEKKSEKKGIDKKTPIRIVSDKMVSHKEKNLVTFIGNVIAYKDDITMYADRLEVYSDKTQKELRKIVSTGHVKIVKEDMIGTCEKAIYDEEKQLITLLENAVVQKEDSIIQGAKILYSLTDEDVVVSRDKKKKIEVILFPEQLEKAKEENEKKESPESAPKKK